MNYTDAAKLKLTLAIKVMQKYGKPGTLIADQLWRERQDWTEEDFVQAIRQKMDEVKK